MVDTINANYPNNVTEKCYEMFNTWLKQTHDPCWCQVADAFKMVKLHEAAREIERKLGIYVHEAAREIENKLGKYESTHYLESYVDDVNMCYGLKLIT